MVFAYSCVTFSPSGRSPENVSCGCCCAEVVADALDHFFSEKIGSHICFLCLVVGVFGL